MSAKKKTNDYINTDLFLGYGNRNRILYSSHHDNQLNQLPIVSQDQPDQLNIYVSSDTVLYKYGV